MKKISLLILAIVSFSILQAQLTTTPSGDNKKAWVGEQIGLTNVEIHYDRPAVKGRDGKIWGQLVHTGFGDQGFGSSKAAPWRAGANENTTIHFSSDVKIEGKELPAGTYGLFVAYDPTESIIIFSKNSVSWGSYYYDEKEDALRVRVKPQTQDKSEEWLKYEFSSQTENSATVNLRWERLLPKIFAAPNCRISCVNCWDAIESVRTRESEYCLPALTYCPLLHLKLPDPFCPN